MANRVCPVWVGYFLLNPLRRLMENPKRMLGPYVREGMTVLEPGCGMGFFTLPLAQMVGGQGRVVAVDIQEKMIQGMQRRAEKAGLLDRIFPRHIKSDSLGVEDLAGQVDMAVALYMVHEVPDTAGFFRDVHQALKTGGRLLIFEPKFHVSDGVFRQCIDLAEKIVLKAESAFKSIAGRGALLVKS